MAYFNNIIIEIYTPYISNDYDVYTDEYLTKYKILDIISVDLQPVSAKDKTLDFGEIQENTYKIYTDYHIPKNAIIKIGNKTFSVTGELQNYDHFKPTTHNKILITEEQEPHKLSGE